MKLELLFLSGVTLLLLPHTLGNSPTCNEPNPSAPVCKILSLSGGGIHGGWEMAVMKGLVDFAESVRQKLDYDFIAGVSAGALNTASSYYTADVNEWVTDTYKIWETIDDRDISDVCHGRQLLWILRKMLRLMSFSTPVAEYQGLCDNNALKRFIKKLILKHGATQHRKYVITALRLYDGQLVQIDETDDISVLADAVVASSSVPGLFTPTELLGNLYVDAGIHSNANTIEAVERCLAMHEDAGNAADPENDNPVNIVVDFLVPSAYVGSYKDARANVVNVIARSSDLLLSRVGGLNPLIRTLRRYPMVRYRYVLAPSISERNQFPGTFDFKMDSQREIMLNLGYLQGLDARVITSRVVKDLLPEDLIERAVHNDCYLKNRKMKMRRSNKFFVISRPTGQT